MSQLSTTLPYSPPLQHRHRRAVTAVLNIDVAVAVKVSAKVEAHSQASAVERQHTTTKASEQSQRRGRRLRAKHTEFQYPNQSCVQIEHGRNSSNTVAPKHADSTLEIIANLTY